MDSNFLEPTEIRFDASKFTLLLNIDKDVLNIGDLQKIAQEKEFEEKDEFHITTIGFKNGSVINKTLEKFSQEDKEEILYQIKSLAYATDWRFLLKPERYHISKKYPLEERESFIQMADLPELKNFYNQLNKILNTNLEVPPPHITLFTKGTDPERSKMGIGINSEREITALNPKPV